MIASSNLSAGGAGAGGVGVGVEGHEALHVVLVHQLLLRLRRRRLRLGAAALHFRSGDRINQSMDGSDLGLDAVTHSQSIIAPRLGKKTKRPVSSATENVSSSIDLEIRVTTDLEVI